MEKKTCQTNETSKAKFHSHRENVFNAYNYFNTGLWTYFR